MAHGPWPIFVISWRQAKRWIWDIPRGNYLYIVDCWMPSGRMKTVGAYRADAIAEKLRLPVGSWGPILWKISVVWKADGWVVDGWNPVNSPVGGQVVCPIIYSVLYIPGGCWGISEPSTVWSVATSSRFHHGAMSVEAASMRFVLTEAGIIIADDFC